MRGSNVQLWKTTNMGKGDGGWVGGSVRNSVRVLYKQDRGFLRPGARTRPSARRWPTRVSVHISHVRHRLATRRHGGQRAGINRVIHVLVLFVTRRACLTCATIARALNRRGRRLGLGYCGREQRIRLEILIRGRSAAATAAYCGCDHRMRFRGRAGRPRRVNVWIVGGRAWTGRHWKICRKDNRGQSRARCGLRR